MIGIKDEGQGFGIRISGPDQDKGLISKIRIKDLGQDNGVKD